MLRISTSKGFTLVELIVAIVIMAMVVTALATALSSSLLAYEQVNDIADINQAARAIIERMCREIRTAQTVTTSDSGGVVTLSLDYGTGASPETITYTIDTNSGAMTYDQSGGAPLYTLVGDTGDDMTMSDADFGVEYRTIDGTSRPTLVTIHLVFNIGDQDYPFGASACLRRWLGEVADS
ncbi:MAG: prepilin-type N-terminal cleavage/methylation domain-containing protein [Planctomycetes bacterium]|jgi:prepilin-type N-terminal cleavage/methylation domain-containing protein|nr:prepilin-type N-terminal cleavage/methylation domain-containing protein [Planctomycetota bacterium]